MPIPIGVFIKSARKLIGYGFSSKKITRRIKELEAEDARPLLSMFSGVERFDAARRLLDAALIQRLRTDGEAERPGVIERYLTRSHEEYTMARENLAAVPATRADIAALGLAFKELTLTFDRELTAFRESSAAELTGIIDAAQAKLREDTTARLDEMAAYVDHAVAADSAAREQIVTLLARQRDEASAEVQRVRAELDAQTTLFGSAHDAHKRAVAALFEHVDACLAKNEAAHGEHTRDVAAAFIRIDGRFSETEAAHKKHARDVAASFARVNTRLAEDEAALTAHRAEVGGALHHFTARVTANETALQSHRTDVAGEMARITAAHRATTARLQWMLAGSLLLALVSLLG